MGLSGFLPGRGTAELSSVTEFLLGRGTSELSSARTPIFATMGLFFFRLPAERSRRIGLGVSRRAGR